MVHGEIYHTIRFSNSWQAWGNVSQAVGNNPGWSGLGGQVGCAGIGKDLHVVARLVPGSLYHTIRFANSWQPWGNVSQFVGNIPGPLEQPTCANIGDDLHVIASGPNGHLYHTIRFASSYTWQPWGNVSVTVQNYPGTAYFPQCARVGNDLHVIAIVAGNLYHTIRYPNGDWQPWGNVSASVANFPGPLVYATCAGIGDDLHIVGMNGGSLYHTIRFASSYTWQPWDKVSTAAGNNPGYLHLGGCAAIGNDLHVIAQAYVNGMQLYHTIKLSNSWKPWDNVSTAAGNNPLQTTDSWNYLSCASTGKNLHVIGVVGPTII